MTSPESVWHEKVDFVAFHGALSPNGHVDWLLAFRVRECNSLIIGRVLEMPEWEPEYRERFYWFPKIGEVQIEGVNLKFEMLPKGVGDLTPDEAKMVNAQALLAWRDDLAGDDYFVVDMGVAA